jgi:hypothetical protein
MATWCFKTAALNERNSSRYLWYWQIDTQDALLFTAIKLFPTLDECVVDARQQGFLGHLTLSHAVSHPALITWTEDGDGSSTTRIDQQAA